MSKLRDRIRDLGRRKAAAFGFAAMREAAAERPRQLVVIAEAADAATATAAIKAGADAILATTPGALGAIVEAAGKTPAGVRIDAATAEAATAAAEAGADFLLFDDATTEASAIVETRLGYLTTVAPATDDATVRLLRLLDLDAVLVAPPPERMTVRQQLQTRRMADLARKPLLTRIEAAISTATLELWRDAGVAGVIAPASITAALRAAADEVPPRREPKPSGRPDAIIPASTGGSDDDEDDE